MSWNAIAGGVAGAQKGLATYLAEKQQAEEMGMKQDALDMEQLKLELATSQSNRALANDEERTRLMRAEQAHNQQRERRADALGTLGGLRGPVQDASIEGLAKEFAPHLLEQRLPSTQRSGYASMPGAQNPTSGFTETQEKGGTFINPYISDQMKAAMLSIDQRTAATENRLASQEAALGVKTQIAEMQNQTRMMALQQRAELLQAQIGQAASRAERDMISTELKRAEMQMEMLYRQMQAQQWAVKQAGDELDPTKNPALYAQSPEALARLRQQRAAELVKGPMGGVPKPDWNLNIPQPTRTGRPTQVAPPAAPGGGGGGKLIRLKDGGVAELQPDGTAVRVQ